MDVKETIEKANTLIAEKQFDEALSLLEKVQSENIEDIEFFKLLGLCNINLENIEKAMVALTKALELNNEDATAWFYLASLYDLQDLWEKAEEAYLKVITLRPEYAEAYKNLTLLALRRDDFILAFKYANKALEYTTGDDYQVYYLLSSLYLKNKRYNEALVLLEKAHKLNPKHVQIINNIAVCYLATGKNDIALKYYKQALVLEPNSELSNLNIASLYQMKNNHEEAFKYYSKAYEINSSLENLASLGFSAIQSNKWSVAIDIYKHLIALQPDKVAFWLNLGTAYTENNEEEKAIEIFEKLYKMNQTNFMLVEKLTELYIYTNQMEKAKDFLAKVVKRGKVPTSIYYNYAIICSKTQDIDTAIYLFKKIIQLEPDNPTPHKDLGVIYLAQNLFNYAKDEFEQALKIAPNNATILFEYANYYYQTNNYTSAENYYKRALEIEPNNIDFKLYSAMNYLYLNKIELAQKYLEELYLIIPESLLCIFNLARVYYLQKKYKNALQVLFTLNQDIENIEIKNLLAMCYLETQEYEKAKNIFAKLLLINNQNTNILTNLAKCYIGLAEKENARVYLRKVLSILPEQEEAQELLNRISE